MELTMTAFQEELATKDANFLMVGIEVVDGAKEHIVIEKTYIPMKMEYYKKTYDEDLKMIANPNVRITSYQLLRQMVGFRMENIYDEE